MREPSPWTGINEAPISEPDSAGTSGAAPLSAQAGPGTRGTSGAAAAGGPGAGSATESKTGEEDVRGTDTLPVTTGDDADDGNTNANGGDLNRNEANMQSPP